jgi:hypothetical protein
VLVQHAQQVLDLDPNAYRDPSHNSGRPQWQSRRPQSLYTFLHRGDIFFGR